MYTIAQVLDPGGQSIDRVLPPPLVKIVGPQLTVGFIADEGSVLKVQMTVKIRGFTALKTEACGLTQAAYLHF